MSARTILKHLHQQGRMTDYQFDVINRNLKERPQGEWATTKGSLEVTCSVCHKGYFYHPCNDFYYNFCPNCGAKMIKEAENEI